MTNTDEINKALLAYLGGGDGRGIVPYNQEQRVRTAFPEKSDELIAECEKVIEIVDCDQQVLNTGNLVEIAENATERIKKKFVWLDTIVALKLGNYYSYQMK